MSIEVIKPPSKEVQQKVRSEFGLNDKVIKESVDQLRKWLECQPHLPKEIDDFKLEHWLIRSKNSMEKVKKTLDLYYTLKTTIPDMMTGWDTDADWFKSITKVVYIFTMPQLTQDCDRVTTFGLHTSDSKDFNVLHFIKIGLMILEIRMSEDYYLSDIYIMDVANYSLAHIAKITIPILKKYELCVLGGYNLRVKAFHIVNATPIVDSLLGMLKVVLKPKLASRIHVHGKDLTELHKQVPVNCLPTEYGGNAGSVSQHWDHWTNKLESYHDIFLNLEHQKSDESKRPDDSLGSTDLLGFEGSFRKLEVD